MLADQLCETLGISTSGAVTLARMRIDELVASGSAEETELAPTGPTPPCCPRCSELFERTDSAAFRVTADADPFELCVYCRQPFGSDG